MKREIDRFFRDNEASAGLGREAMRSSVVSVIARSANILVQVGSTILLARLLSPYDYGLVAIVFALLGFAPMLIDLGTTDACVQKKRITEAEVSALFWVNVAIGGTLTLLLVGGSKFIAHFYGEPALAGIALVSSLTFVVAALSTQHYALMRRGMQFQRIAMIEITANVVSSVIAIVMALTGWGYWALVAKPILTIGFSAVGVWWNCPWLPGRPRFTPEAKEVVGFGMNVTGFTMTDYVARSADRIALGYVYGAVPLGYFQNAFLLYENLLSILTSPLHNIAVVSLSKLRSVVDELRRSWAAALSSLSFFSSLAFAILAVTGQDVVAILLGEKWAPAGPLLCIFAVRGIAHVVERTLGWLHVAVGRSDRWMRWGIFSSVCQLAAVFAGIPFGFVGVATAHAIITFCLFVPALAYAGRPIGIGAQDVIRVVGPQTVAGLGSVAMAFTVRSLLLDDYSLLWRFILSTAICAAVYFAIVVGLFRVTQPLRLAFSLLRDFVPTRLRRTP